MDASFGFVGGDYALLASDCSVPRSIVLMKSYEDKILELGTQTLFALSGEVGDRYVIIMNLHDSQLVFVGSDLTVNRLFAVCFYFFI